MRYREVIRKECGCWEEREGLTTGEPPVARGWCDAHRPEVECPYCPYCSSFPEAGLCAACEHGAWQQMPMTSRVFVVPEPEDGSRE